MAVAPGWGRGGPSVLPGYLEHDVAVGFVELAVESLVHQRRHEVLDLPDAEAGQLPHILAEELRVVQLRLLQALVPAARLQVRCFCLPALLRGRGQVTKLGAAGSLPAPRVGQGHRSAARGPSPTPDPTSIFLFFSWATSDIPFSTCLAWSSWAESLRRRSRILRASGSLVPLPGDMGTG